METLYSQLGAVLVLLLLGFAFWRGGEAERAGAGVYLLGWLASMLVSNYSGLAQPQYAVFALDCLVFLLLLLLTFHYRLAWPMWAAAFQLIGLLAHVSVFLGMKPPAFSYLTAVVIASYGVLGSIAVGAFIAGAERDAANTHLKL